jgi:hypothetical protein
MSEFELENRHLEERGTVDLMFDSTEVRVYWNTQTECVTVMTEGRFMELTDSRDMTTHELMLRMIDIERVAGYISTTSDYSVEMDDVEGGGDVERGLRREQDRVVNIPIRELYYVMLQMYGSPWSLSKNGSA